MTAHAETETVALALFELANPYADSAFTSVLR